MTTVACPRCRDEVTVPPQVSDEALVRCPLCSEEYALSEATRSVPPMLIVVGPGAVVPAAELPSGDELRLVEPMEAPRPVVLREAPVRRPPPRGYPVRRAKNPIVEVLKIVGGGVIGLAIGQLILWWMPGDWDVSNRDPANLAATVARYAPWLVPAELQPYPVSTVESEDIPALPPPGERRRPPPATLPDFNMGEDFEPDEAAAQEVPADLSQDESSVVEIPPRDDERAAEANSDNGESDDPAMELNAPQQNDEIPPLDDGPEDAAANSGEPAEATNSAAEPRDSSSLVEAVESALSKWNGDEPAASAGAALEALRAAAADLSRVASNDESARAAEGKLRDLIGIVLNDESKLAALAAVSGARPIDGVPDGEGVVLLGTIEQLAEAGTLWEIKLHRAEGENLVVLAPRAVTPALVVNQQLLVLGTLVAEPRVVLASYAGDAKPVIYSRLAMPVGP